MAKKTPPTSTKKAPSPKPRSARKAVKMAVQGGKKILKIKRVAAPTPAAKVLAFPVFYVDSFTARALHGNPAAVVPLEAFLDTDVMCNIAAEHNLSETAFMVPAGSKQVGKARLPKLKLRWFTPTTEVDLCGHATLAAAHVLFEHVGLQSQAVVFSTRSGDLIVSRQRAAGGLDLLTLDFPAKVGNKTNISTEMCAAIGQQPAEAYLADDLMLVLENRRQVYELAPELGLMSLLPGRGVIVTAPGSGHDFISRCFYPKLGIAEDPVTGSAHCTLVPYWSARLGKASLRAHQVSRRGGELWCELQGQRVMISGHAVTYGQSKAQISV